MRRYRRDLRLRSAFHLRSRSSYSAFGTPEMRLAKSAIRSSGVSVFLFILEAP